MDAARLPLHYRNCCSLFSQLSVRLLGGKRIAPGHKRTRITVGRIDGGRVHPQNHYTDSETDISLSPAVGHAFTGEGIYRQKSILIRTQNSRKDIMYFNTFISILYIMWLKGWLKTFFNKF